MRGETDRHHEGGFSLVEVLVVLALVGVVLGALLSSFESIQNATSDNLTRQQMIEKAELAMQVVSRDIRATADDPTGNFPLISTMTATSIKMKSNIDTTSAANLPAAGNASAYSGCPDEVLITGSSPSYGPITETRTHPDSVAQAPACHWPTSPSAGYTANTHARVIVDQATLALVYSQWADPTSATPPATGTPTTTASVQITITVPPADNSPRVAAIQLVQTVPLATFSNSIINPAPAS